MLTSITSNEPDNGLGDGDFPNDIQGATYGTPDVDFQLRSERSGTGDGRTYTIVYTGLDGSGNSSQAVVTVLVPHDQAGTAKSGNGYDKWGTNWLPRATTFDLVILSSSTFDALGIVRETAQIGGWGGKLTALQTVLKDVNGDRRDDLVVRFSVSDARRLRAIDSSLAFRYETTDGVGYLVPNIFALGPPVFEAQRLKLAGHLADAQQMLGDAREAAHRSGNNYVAAIAQIFLFRIVAAHGQLHQAAAAYQQLIAASGPSPIAALAQVDLARLLYKWNELEAAAQQAQRAIEFSQRGGNAEIMLASYRTLALIKQTQGDTAAAQAALQESIHLAEQPGLSPSARWHELAYRVLITLLDHDLAACAHLIAQYPPLDQVETLPDYLLLSSTQAQWLLTQEQRSACAELLSARYDRASRAGVQQALGAPFH